MQSDATRDASHKRQVGFTFIEMIIFPDVENLSQFLGGENGCLRGDLRIQNVLKSDYWNILKLQYVMFLVGQLCKTSVAAFPCLRYFVNI